MPAEERYTALALQTRCQTVNRLQPEEARQQMLASIQRIGAQLLASRAFIGPQVRLAVLPEYFLTGFPMGESTEEWSAKACITPEGPEYEALAGIARDQGIYLSGNVYETDPHFPKLYFQVSFVLDDSGNQVLRYRRLVSMYSPTPHDVLERYLEIYGADALFPVADTPLGRMAAVASEEILYPEISRALALRGAEILCHSSSEGNSQKTSPKDIAKQARAFENHVYLLSANSGGLEGSSIPPASASGGSRIVDYEGRIIAIAGHGESMLAYADIDLAALRHYRRRPSMFNSLARQRLDLFANTYTEDSVYPANTLLNEDGTAKTPTRGHYRDTQAAVIKQLIEKGII